MRHVLQARRVGSAANHAGNADLDLAGGGGDDAAHRQRALADLAPGGHLAPGVRPFLLELFDRGERFLAHARGVDGLGRLDHVVEDLGRLFGLAWRRALENGEPRTALLASVNFAALPVVMLSTLSLSVASGRSWMMRPIG